MNRSTRFVLLVPAVCEYRLDRRYDRRFDRLIHRWWWHDYRRHNHQTWELGEEVHLTGFGMLGSRSVTHPEPVKGAEAPTTEFRAYHGVLKVYAKTDDVVVTCRGKGYKRTITTKDGYTITKCRGIGLATVAGTEFMFLLKARAGQAWFPAGSAGTLHSWGYWWLGDLIPVVDDTPLDEIKPVDPVPIDPPKIDPPKDVPSDETGKDSTDTTESGDAKAA